MGPATLRTPFLFTRPALTYHISATPERGRVDRCHAADERRQSFVASLSRAGFELLGFYFPYSLQRIEGITCGRLLSPYCSEQMSDEIRRLASFEALIDKP